MKKKLTAIALIVALFSLLIVGGTFSFFKDTEKATNVLTMGDIDIMLRECNGDRNQTNDEYLTWLDGQILEPSINIEKEVWVENIGDNDAYVRVFVVWPKAMTPMLSLTWDADLGNNWAAEAVNYTIGGVEYTGHCLVYKANEGVLEAGKITADTLTDVKLLSAVECEVVGENTVYTIIADGVKHTYTTNTADFPVLVCAQAGQTTNEEGNWTTATEALNYMFGEPADAATNPWADMWDGTTNTEWKPDDNTVKVYEVATAEDLAGLAQLVNSGDTFSGKTVKLTSDINLAGMEWTPIGNSTNKFLGTFDGQNNTISNLTVTGNNSYVGLFGFTTNGTVKNLTIENANVSGYLGVGVLAGSPYTTKYENITIKGHVEVNGFAYVGGMGGRNCYADVTNVTIDVDDTSYVKAVSVDNSTAYRTYVGGVIGFMGEGGHKLTNVTSNIDVIGSTIDVGGIVGIAHYGNSFINCSGSGDVTVTNAAEASDAEEIGGIAGVWNNGGSDVTFEGCSYTGTLSANITAGVDLSDNTIVGAAYSASGSGNLIIK